MGKLKALTATLALSTALVAAGWTLGAPAAPGGRELAGLVLFFLIVLMAESKPLLLPDPQGGPAELTLSGLPACALAVLFSPLHAGAVAAAAVLVSEILVKRRALVWASFGTCQTFLSVAAAATLRGLVLAHPLTTRVSPEVTAAACAALTYFVCSRGLVRLALSCLEGMPARRGSTAHERWEALYIGCGVPLALVLILAYERLWIAGPFLFLGPVFLVRESYAQYVRLKTNYKETVRTLVKVIETHDVYTAGHSLRVAEYGRRLAIALKLRAKEVEKIEIAAYLHDLGKVDLAITDLVQKPGRLTPEEQKRVQLHPVESAELAAQVTVFRGDIEAIIRYHHENHDGTGYPYGLHGEQIPLGARIIHVVDAFDAMVSSRVYRPAMTFEQARAELGRCAGTQFDPEVVSVFLTACMQDESMVLPQVEAAYEAALEEQEQEALRTRGAVFQSRGEPLLRYA